MAQADLPVATAEEPVTAPARRRGRRHLIQLALVLAALGSLVLVGGEFPDVDDMWRAASHADPGWLVVAAVAELASMGAFARLQRRLLHSGGVEISLRRAVAVTYAGNAMSTTLPAGPAVSVVFAFRQWRRSGASTQLATAVILVGGVLTTTAYTLVGLVALLAEPHSRGPVIMGLGLFAVAVAAVALVLRHPGWRARMYAGLRRTGCAILRHRRVAPYAGQVREGLGVLRPTRADWGVLALFSLLNWVFDILALVAATRATGVGVPPYAVALAYFAAQAAGSLLPLLPGGIGAIESSMIAALVAFGATLAPAGAAVGLYRLISYWGVVMMGWLAWLMLHEGPWRVPGFSRARMAALGRGLATGMASFSYAVPNPTVLRTNPVEGQQAP